ncbi:MAG: hypothetical protein HY360_00855 [Verrucomicrobia bacterium]|nr:hypothetical protein [Verrucomicrobiota bacterium]
MSTQTPWTRHQRCAAAIEGKPVDRAPTYIPAIACQVASQILGRAVHTGTGSLHYAEVLAWSQGEAAHEDFEAQFWEDIVAIHRALDIDVFRMPWRMNMKPAAQTDEYTFVFGDPAGDHSIWRYNPVSADFGESARVSPPRQEQGKTASLSEDDLDKSIERLEADLENEITVRSRVLDAHLEIWRKLGDEFFVICNGGGIGLEHTETEMMFLALAPGLIRRKLMRQAECGIALGRGLVHSGCPAVLVGGGDLAGNQGLIYSPKSFREVVLPACKHLLNHLNPLGAHYIFRSDGNLWAIADKLFEEAGCPGYGEVDREAGMKAADLRRRFPKLVLWGNISSSLLTRATVGEVKEESRRIIDESAGSRYFHGCSNAIVTGTPPRNVEAMFAAR